MCCLRRSAYEDWARVYRGHPLLGIPVFLTVLQNGGQSLHSFTRVAVSLDGIFDKNRTFKGAVSSLTHAH